MILRQLAVIGPAQGRLPSMVRGGALVSPLRPAPRRTARLPLPAGHGLAMQGAALLGATSTPAGRSCCGEGHARAISQRLGINAERWPGQIRMLGSIHCSGFAAAAIAEGLRS